MLLNKYNLNLIERGVNMGFTLNQLEQERQIRNLQKKEDQDTKDYEKLSNLPKINNVELKGNKTTSDLGINADNVMMSDGVTSVEEVLDGLTARTFGTSIALTSNTSITAPSDGYVVYSCGSKSGDYCYLYINNVNMGHATFASNLSALPLSCLFVKKGMTIKFEGVNAYAAFYPLES